MAGSWVCWSGLAGWRVGSNGVSFKYKVGAAKAYLCHPISAVRYSPLLSRSINCSADLWGSSYGDVGG